MVQRSHSQERSCKSQSASANSSQAGTDQPVAELELGTITVDTIDARALAAWWARVLDGSVDDFPDAKIHVVRTDRLKGLNLAFQQTTNPTPGKNKIHLDFGAADRSSIVAGLVALGAQRVEDHVFRGLGWTVLADPDGNHFCVSDLEPSA